MKPTVKVSRTGRVTLKIDASDLAGIVEDAAESEAKHTCTPGRETIEMIAEACAEWFSVHNPDAPEVELADRIARTYSKPLSEVLED